MAQSRPGHAPLTSLAYLCSHSSEQPIPGFITFTSLKRAKDHPSVHLRRRLFSTATETTGASITYTMAPTGQHKPAGSVEEYDMGHESVERVHGDALGGTSYDARDMQRMGKKQELRVSVCRPYRSGGTYVCDRETSASSPSSASSLSCSQHGRALYCECALPSLSVVELTHAKVSLLRPIQWRYCRCYLHDNHYVAFRHGHDSVSRRDGLDVSRIRMRMH